MRNIITQEEKNRIDEICQEYNIKNYTINPNGSIDVNGSVSFQQVGSSGLPRMSEIHPFTSLPLKFNKVSGNFVIPSYQKLTTLKGAPSYVGGNFRCGNNGLTSLEGCPIEVGGDFDCRSNQIITLEYVPNKIGSNFICGYNRLSSLESHQVDIGGYMVIVHNELPIHFNMLYDSLDNDEKHVFTKYHHMLEVWSNGRYDPTQAELLYDEIKTGLC